MRRALAKPDKTPWKSGDRLIQPDLARTLESIANAGPDSFYKGPIADAIIATLDTGFMTTADLAAYEAKIRQPIHGTFRAHDIFAPPPPSSGGIAVIQMLNMLEHLNLRQHERFSPQALHLMIETMRRAYYDRARHIGDPDFVSIPSHLTTKEYAASLARQINPSAVTSSQSIAGEINLAPEGAQTTHFSVIDKDGMAVSNTYTLEERYGGRVMVKGMGFLLNNEMGDFNHAPGLTNRAGRIGTAANLVAPRKRMLSSMTPVIVAKDGKVVMLTGSPGGRTIINTVLCVLINRLEYQMPPRDCVDAPRLNMTWFPDKVTAEAALHKDHAPALDELKKMGHTVDPKPARQGDAHTIIISEDGTILGLADKRRGGSAAGY
jgi:gamma-glutamyltranspeptidase/glutathione hydrolase